MTTDDFLRSVCAGGPTQPDGLRLDQYRKLSIEHLQREYSPTKSQQASVLFGSHALIEYSEYVLLRALLATPQKAFHIAFQVIDRDDSGTMEMDEFFDVVQSVSGTTGLKPIDTERSLVCYRPGVE
ncbi:hypothetical protein SARC_10897 [Sphaeroforma arctica JP610]|uniref:EF-hand domain-containing protein n=1 Tax=Sphaeroforma arctica JP610 TaxID=667725 RepID=A0A0L0FIL7_9EUKA|nr:hypothetical protein SARC_10897 [Sphaeroforma arctica JP610]KNC76614.1 hypothetical protein SARC_10897 [Sphaeroforma arctica JP610]|eukprot:XP_014150516.1 hypothetical protein SARC_10897 [Sphaeroforma arctica JP610]